MTPEHLKLYQEAMAADQHYSDLLEARYGKSAADARYDRNRNGATPELLAARKAKIKADEALHAANMALWKGR